MTNHSSIDTNRTPVRLGIPLSFQRVGGLTVLILAAVLSLTSYLNYANFERAYLDLVRSRSEVLAQDFGHAVEYGLNLGLRLEQMTQLPRLLAETQAGDSHIRWVMVVNSKGKPVFSAPENAAERVGQISLHGLNKQDENYLTLTPVLNSFGKESGAVVIAWSRDVVDAKLLQVASGLIQYLAIVLITFAFLLFLAVRKQGRAFAYRELRLRGVLDGSEPMRENADDPVESEINRLALSAQSVMNDISDIERLLDRPASGASIAEQKKPEVTS